MIKTLSDHTGSNPNSMYSQLLNQWRYFMEVTQEQYEASTQELFHFIENSPSCFHAIAEAAAMLASHGFTELMEETIWKLEKGKSYFVRRSGSALIGFKIPEQDFSNFQIIASHSDSPSFKLKENPEMKTAGHYTKLNVERYGGMICAPWFDRPLSIAGKVMVREGNRFVSRLVNLDRDLVMIVNLAVHMNRGVNDGYSYNAQKDLLPIFGDECADGALLDLVADSLGVAKDSIVGTDLYLYNRMKGSIWGARREFISSPKLDDLQCAFSSVKALIEGGNETGVSVCAILDNEEVGSGSKQGARSPFLHDVLRRISLAFGKSEEEHFASLASSFLVSADNGHAIHPNYEEKCDPVNKPHLGGGVLIKFAGSQSYTTDSVSYALFRSILDDENIPYQLFFNRSDLPGGSTLGNLSTSHVAINSVDIGVAQLAMHSPYETGSIKDTFQLTAAMTAFYQYSILADGNGCYVVQKA